MTDSVPEKTCPFVEELTVMDGEKTEGCGIIGIAHSNDAGQDIYYSLRILQHRGQESTGIAVFDKGIECVKGMGLVNEVFPRGAVEKIHGSIGIGHVRYSTTGTSKLENAQPVVVKTKYGDLAIAHNGDMVNSDELRDELHKIGAAFITETDSEIILRLLANEISSTKNIYKAIRVLVNKIIGSFSLLLLFNDRLFAVRDPLAVRPLCIGSKGDMMIAASESVVPDMLGGKFLRDVEPGEIVELTHEFHSVKLPTPQHSAHCMFEWVYFARPDSILDGRLVYDVRKRIGEGLAKEHPLEADVVIPIPDSGRSQAEGFSSVSGIPTSEGFVKNRHIERTFIMPNQDERESAVRLKLNPIRDIVKGKRVVLVDDSIVRGTTMRKIVEMVRDVGAEEVHVRIGCPPIIAPCFLGIDMKTRDQFAATGRKVDEIAKLITADSLGYISIEGLVKAIGQSASDLCLGCITAEYPVPIPGEQMRFQKKLDAFWKNHVLMGR